MKTRVQSVGLLRPRVSVDEELDAFWNDEERSLGLRSNLLGILGVEPPPSFDECVEAARQRRRIRDWLKLISDSDAGVLQCAYEYRRWPEALVRRCGRLSGVVVRLACAMDRWPADSTGTRGARDGAGPVARAGVPRPPGHRQDGSPPSGRGGEALVPGYGCVCGRTEATVRRGRKAVRALPLRAMYSLGELARASSMDRRLLKRLLVDAGVEPHTLGRLTFIRITDLHERAFPLWEAIQTVQTLATSEALGEPFSSVHPPHQAHPRPFEPKKG